MIESTADIELRNRLSDLCNMSRTPFELIGSEDQALLAQDKWNRTTKGVFIICKGLVRGLDFKLGADAHCCIYDCMNTFSESDVLQAMGRSSRTQG